MHTYLDAVGFRKVKNARGLENLVRETVVKFDQKKVYRTADGRIRGEFSKQYAEDIGLTVCGEIDDVGSFHPEFEFPFYHGHTVSMRQYIDCDKHAATDSYGTVCEDPRIGTSVIFYLTNAAEYEMAKNTGWRNDHPVNIRLTALARDGTVLLPVYKTPQEEEEANRRREEYLKMVAGAREGDEEMIDALTEDDMNSYNILQKRVVKEDVMSIVETYFQPWGIECDIYSVCGNIVRVEKAVNSGTGSAIWKMQIESCDVYFDLCVSEEALMGEPAVGARFRGRVWLQGIVEFA